MPRNSSEGGIAVVENDVYKPDAPEAYKEKGGLYVPGSEVVKPKEAGQVLVPEGVARRREVATISREEMKRYGAHEVPEPKVRKGSEIAQAYSNVQHFLVAEAAGRNIDLGTVGPIFEHSVDVDADRWLKDPKDLHRATVDKKFYNRYSGETETMTESRPGNMEKLGLVLCDVICEPTFKKTEVAVKGSHAFAELVREYRLDVTNTYGLAPEMPDLTNRLIEVIDQLTVEVPVRHELCQVLEQLQIPDSAREPLLRVLDAQHDLATPLAYRLNLEVTASRSDSPWVVEQRERREVLLELLKGSPQECFDNYKTLKGLARGLVYHGDPLNPEAGKVGMEIEYGYGEFPSNDAAIPKGFTDGEDPDGNGEVRRSRIALEHGAGYLWSLAPLSLWLKDNASHVAGFHLHFDREYFPDIGNLLGNTDNLTVEEGKNTPTFEVRGLMAPLTYQHTTLNPGVVEDLIGLYLEAVKEDTLQLREKPLLTIPQGVAPTTEQLIFGHICRYLPSENARLAALMALRDPWALRSINPKSILNDVYDESLSPAFVALIEEVSSDYQKESLQRYAISMNPPDSDLLRRIVLSPKYAGSPHTDLLRGQALETMFQIDGPEVIANLKAIVANQEVDERERDGAIINLDSRTEAFEASDYPLIRDIVVNKSVSVFLRGDALDVLNKFPTTEYKDELMAVILDPEEDDFFRAHAVDKYPLSDQAEELAKLTAILKDPEEGAWVQGAVVDALKRSSSAQANRALFEVVVNPEGNSSLKSRASEALKVSDDFSASDIEQLAAIVKDPDSGGLLVTDVAQALANSHSALAQPVIKELAEDDNLPYYLSKYFRAAQIRKIPDTRL